MNQVNQICKKGGAEAPPVSWHIKLCCLPKRLTDMPQDPKRPNTRVPLEQMKKTYYRARGWEKNGLPSEKKLRRLGIR